MSNNKTIAVADDSILGYFLSINFLHFALFLFLFCSAILMIVSKMSVVKASEYLDQLTFKKGAVSFKWTNDVKLTVVLVILVLILWVVFSPWGIG